MKKNILFVATLLFIVSCNKILDPKPVDRVTPTEAFSSSNGLALYCNSFYNKQLPSAKAIFSGDQLSDYATVNVTSKLLLGTFTAQEDASGWDWSDLRNINYFLEHYDNPVIPQEDRNNYAGIARFFRAWFYFNMVKKFGPVPWFNKALKPDDPAIYKARDSRALVMDSVLADINFACNNINDNKDASSSTITRSVALALKSRICLFEGTFRKYHTESLTSGKTIINADLSATASNWLKEAADAASKLMQSGKYKLHNTGNPHSDYRDLFISENPVSDEVLLAQTYNDALQRWHDANWWFTSPTYGLRLNLTKSIIDTYLNIDGTRFTDKPGYDSIPFIEETKNRDFRLEQTIRLGAYKRANGTAAPPDFNYSYTGYQIKKYTVDDNTLDSKAQNFNSIPVIRYAEVLLNYAEAKAELGKFTVDDWDKSIKLLRERAGISNTDMPTTSDPYLQKTYFPEIQSTALLEIRRERAIELMCEGFRYDDLIRWKKGKLMEKTFNGIYVPKENENYDLDGNGTPDVCFVQSVPSQKQPGVVYYVIDGTSTTLSNGSSGNLLWLSNVKKTFADRNYFYPIPFDQLVLTGKALDQNPGW